MAECCTTPEPTYPGTHRCPVNGKPYREVPVTTVMHHIDQPWKWDQKDQGYYFCDDPDCDVVYFGSDNSTINKSSLRTVVGVKESSADSLVCYCFGVDKRQSLDSPEARAFIVEQTRNQACSCTTSNPSGRCCLKDFPK